MNEVLKRRIRDLLQEKNITQKVLADEIGITGATLSRNINGVHEVKADVLAKIASFFNVSTDYLLGNTDDKNKTIVEPEQLSQIDIALYNATSGLSDKEKDQILDFVNYIKNKKPNS